jgi:hypothetical protein
MPMVIAIVGVGGTLAAAITTQIFSSMRERRQWERQREQDDLRWVRERSERQEQWGREDQARWHRETFAAYSEFMSALEAWEDIALKVKPFPPVGRREVTPEGRRELDLAQEKIDKALISIEFLAPERIRGAARAVYVQASAFPLHYKAKEKDWSDEQIEKEVNRRLDAIHKNHWRMRSLCRAELGIEPAASDQPTG